MSYPGYSELEDAARAKGMLWYFECDTDILPPIYDYDDKRVRAVKSERWNHGDLYMERNVLAPELAKIWTAQGWTTYVAQFTHVGYLGPRFIKRLTKRLATLNVGPWTMCPVESSWAVVFAAKNPEDIKVFQGL